MELTRKTNYRVAYDKGWQDVKARAPEEIAARLAVTYCHDTRRFTIRFFNSEYVLDWDSETIWRKADGQRAEMLPAIIMLNYLSFSEVPSTPVGNWVSLKEIPNGGMLFYPAFQQTAIAGIIKTFGRQPERLLQAAAALGGRPATFGDASAIFSAFTEIPLCIIVWQGDEEIPANATILYDPTVAELLHIESLIGLGMYLSQQLTAQN